MKLTAEEIVKASGGILLCGDPKTEITSFSTDSRDIQPGCLFVPIKGERTDAHIYIEATLAAGAAGTFTQYRNAPTADSHPWIYVEDTGQALQKVAAWYRSLFSIPVVGITGSVGKTTTKEMVALALSAQYNTMRTQGNQNSQIGLPLTIFQLSPEHEAAVVEMGMSEFGEMGRLAAIARPTMAVMTNIGLSHIGQLKTQENILREKLHITDGFTSKNRLILNGDDPFLASVQGKTPFPVISYGFGDSCEYRAEEIETNDKGTSFVMVHHGRRLPVFVPAFGIHMVYNALAAIAVAEQNGIPAEKAAEALQQYRPLAMRQQRYEANGVTVIDDTYNASPDSMMGSVECAGFHEGFRPPDCRTGRYAGVGRCFGRSPSQCRPPLRPEETGYPVCDWAGSQRDRGRRQRTRPGHGLPGIYGQRFGAGRFEKNRFFRRCCFGKRLPGNAY